MSWTHDIEGANVVVRFKDGASLRGHVLDIRPDAFKLEVSYVDDMNPGLYVVPVSAVRHVKFILDPQDAT